MRTAGVEALRGAIGRIFWNMNTIDERSAADNTAAKVDKAFFRTHPNQISYCRKVVRSEVPNSLRRLNVCAVHVSRIPDDCFLRFFIDAKGRAVGHSLFIGGKHYSSAVRRRMARTCQIAFDAFLSSEGR